MPTLRAALSPLFSWWMTWMPSKPSAILPVRSVDPSSTTITSKAGYLRFWSEVRLACMVGSALYAQITTETLGYSASAGSPGAAYQRCTAWKAGLRRRSRSTRPTAQFAMSQPPGAPLVGKRKHPRPRHAHLERGAPLPRQGRGLHDLPLAERVDAELGQDQRPVAGQAVQARQVPAELGLRMQIDVEGQEVGEVGLEVLGGGEVGVAHQGGRLDALDHAGRLPQEPGDPLRPVPADDVGRDLVADQERAHRGMAAAGPHHPP